MKRVRRNDDTLCRDERRLLDAGTDCVGDTPYHHRAWLLDQLTGWYRSELRDLEDAIRELTSRSLSHEVSDLQERVRG